MNGISVRTLIILAIIVFAGLFLRTFLLSGKSFFIDEIYQITWAKGYEADHFYGVNADQLGIRLNPKGLKDAFYTVHRHNPPLNALLLNLWLRTTGASSDSGIRFMYVLFGSLTVLVVFFIGRELFSPDVGLWAAALTALSPFHVYYSQEANHYAAAVFFMALSYLFYFRWLKTLNWRDAALYIVATTIALFGHYYVIISVAFQLLGLIAMRGIGWKAIVSASPVVVVLFLFGLDMNAIRAQIADSTPSAFSGIFGGLGYFLDRLHANLLFHWIGEAGNHSFPTWLGVPFLVIVFTVITLGLIKQRDKRIVWVAGLNAVGPLAVIFIAYWFMLKNQILWPRYGIFCSFLLYLMVSIWLADEPRHLARRASAAIIIFAMIFGLYHYYFKFKKQDWKQVAEIVSTVGNERDPVIVFLPNGVYPLAHYLNTDNVLYGVFDGPDLEGQIGEATAGKDAAWIVVAWAGNNSAVPRIKKYLACDFTRQVDYPVDGIEVVRYFNRPSADSAINENCGLLNSFEAAEDCVVFPDTNEILVRGWIDARDTDSKVGLYMDGNDIGDAVIISRPDKDGSTLPDDRKGIKRLWFEKVVSMTGRPDGIAFMMLPFVRSGGAIMTGRNSLMCLKKERIAGSGTDADFRFKGNIETPEEGKRTGAREILVRGWIFSTKGISSLSYEIDGKEVKRSRMHGYYRPDVAQAFKDVDTRVATYSGFGGAISVTGDGRHVLVIRAIQPDGSSQTLPSREFFLTNPR